MLSTFISVIFFSAVSFNSFCVVGSLTVEEARMEAVMEVMPNGGRILTE